MGLLPTQLLGTGVEVTLPSNREPSPDFLCSSPSLNRRLEGGKGHDSPASSARVPAADRRRASSRDGDRPCLPLVCREEGKEGDEGLPLGLLHCLPPVEEEEDRGLRVATGFPFMEEKGCRPLIVGERVGDGWIKGFCLGFT